MSNWPISVPGGAIATTGAAITTNSGAAPTWGAWVELAAAAPPGLHGITLHRTTGTVPARFLVQLGIGPASAEVPVATVFFAVTSSASHLADSIFLPVRIPPGARLALRTVSDVGARVTRWRADYMTGAWLTPMSGRRIVTYGLDLATLAGTALTSGSNGAWGAGVEVVAAVPRRARAFAITGFGATNSVTLRGLVGAFYGTTLATIGRATPAGAPASSDFLQTCAAPVFTPCDVPAGSNLRLRLLNDDATVAIRAFQLHLVF